MLSTQARGSHPPGLFRAYGTDNLPSVFLNLPASTSWAIRVNAWYPRAGNDGKTYWLERVYVREYYAPPTEIVGAHWWTECVLPLDHADVPARFGLQRFA